MNLDALFNKFGTDKGSNHHYYSPYYEELFRDLENYPLSLFIIGIGGYHHIDKGGGDLKSFYEYLPKSYIDAIDIYDKTFLDNDRIKTHIVSQTDEKGLVELMKTGLQMGFPHIITDDGSHRCPDVIKSFEILFPYLLPGGSYVIEDVHSSYWDELATDGTDFGGGNHPNTTMNYFKHLCDVINGEEILGRLTLRNIESEKFPIKSIKFCRKMIIIEKL